MRFTGGGGHSLRGAGDRLLAGGGGHASGDGGRLAGGGGDARSLTGEGGGGEVVRIGSWWMKKAGAGGGGEARLGAAGGGCKDIHMGQTAGISVGRKECRHVVQSGPVFWQQVSGMLPGECMTPTACTCTHRWASLGRAEA